MTATEQNILKTLGYFDLFQYPLTKEEICLFHPEHVLRLGIDAALEILISRRSVYSLEEFYSLQNDPVLVQKRRKGNILAAKQMETAQKVASFLAGFPYVKGIAVSGSLSKNFANEKTDIDFFVITDANRLWIARTIMHLYKKLTFITDRQHWFCMNYYVDEVGLEITEKNIFTAIEIVTLLPMQGEDIFHDFMTTNNWTKKYFPGCRQMHIAAPGIKKGFFRNTIEKIFNGVMGNAFDKWLMHVTEKRWQKKTMNHRLNSKGVRMGMVVDRHFSKPDPRNFQDKIIERYRVKVQQLLQVQDERTSVIQ